MPNYRRWKRMVITTPVEETKEEEEIIQNIPLSSNEGLIRQQQMMKIIQLKEAEELKKREENKVEEVKEVKEVKEVLDINSESSSGDEEDEEVPTIIKLSNYDKLTNEIDYINNNPNELIIFFKKNKKKINRLKGEEKLRFMSKVTNICSK